MPKGAKPVSHIEINVTDLQRAGKFYGALFGWSYQPVMKDYAFWKAGKLGGGFNKVAKKSTAPNSVTLYITVDDIPAMLKKAVSKGGKVVGPKQEIGGGHGFCGQLSDPFGNVVGLWSAR